MHPGIPMAMVFVGCCSNVLFLEQIIKHYPNSGNMITFTAFLFNCLEGLFFTTRFLTKRPAIPLKYYMWMVSFFFVVQTLNNYTLGMNIPMPLHMIFRAGSLIANLTLGVIILKRRYKVTKYLSAIVITLGIVISTVASANQKQKLASHTGDAGYDYMVSVIGIALLILSLFLSARMGIFQETTYAQFGKHPSEALFYNHFLPLPGLLFLSPSIYASAVEMSQSAPYAIPVIGLSIPWAWLALAMNTITQFVCLKSVFILTSECTSLTVTLVVTLRKFVSLVFSIIYFQNPFTALHWAGALCVFLGTLVFLDVFSRFKTYQALDAFLERKLKKAEDPKTE